MKEIEGTTNTGKTDIFTKFLAELQAAGIDPSTVFVVEDEAHGDPDFNVLQKMRELAVSGRCVVVLKQSTAAAESRRYCQYPSIEAIREAGLFNDLDVDACITLHREERPA